MWHQKCLIVIQRYMHKNISPFYILYTCGPRIKPVPKGSKNYSRTLNKLYIPIHLQPYKIKAPNETEQILWSNFSFSINLKVKLEIKIFKIKIFTYFSKEFNELNTYISNTQNIND